MAVYDDRPCIEESHRDDGVVMPHGNKLGS
jgi:hypothetical protein